MTHTADDLAILAAVCAAPDDDTPRLVYADRLDETAGSVPCRRCCGEGVVPASREPCSTDIIGCPACAGAGFVSDGRAEYAEFIRVQCRIAAHPGRRYSPDATYGEYADLHARELELFRGMVHAGRVSFGLPKSFVTTLDQVNANLQTPTDHTFPVAFVRRGFPDEIRCTLAAWCGGVCERCADQPGWAFVGNRLRRCPTCKGTGRTPSIAGDVVRAAPTVTRVVTDAEPYWNGAGYCWYDASRPPPYHNVPVSANLPRPVFDGVKGWVAGRSRWKGFPKRDAALDALSAALVSHGREASGLGWWGGAWPDRPCVRIAREAIAKAEGR